MDSLLYISLIREITKMRKRNNFLLLTITTLLGALILSACGDSEASDAPEETTKLKVSTVSIPHAEILEEISDDLAEDGVELELSILSDGIQSNQQTADGQFDVNFFQHTPYLEQVNEDSGLNLVEVTGVHIEPFGVYSRNIDSIDELSDKAKVSIPKDPVNFSRALELLAANDVIELDKEVQGDYTLEDITENEKDLEFVAVDSELLVHSLDDVEAAAINTNYALEGDFNPLEDALIIEGNDSPYVNILVSRPDNQEDEAIQTLVKHLTSDKVKDFIEEEYEGAVVPAF